MSMTIEKLQAINEVESQHNKSTQKPLQEEAIQSALEVLEKQGEIRFFCGDFSSKYFFTNLDLTNPSKAKTYGIDRGVIQVIKKHAENKGISVRQTSEYSHGHLIGEDYNETFIYLKKV